MNTFLSYLTVLAVFVLLALPSLVGQAQERRIDRELAQRPPDPEPVAPERESRRRAVLLPGHARW
ncbi:hypothetical protein AB0M87_02955 [Streptomyces sp. NPDC051320]|uniref:hypothetical protein n=1 Tax=Streptomyces sp. NPDC051320 TaxID=3154644 RepID=UPI00342266E5